MKTYNFKMTRVFETIIKVDAQNEQDAQKKFDELQDEIYYEEIRQCNVVEENIKLETI